MGGVKGGNGSVNGRDYISSNINPSGMLSTYNNFEKETQKKLLPAGQEVGGVS